MNIAVIGKGGHSRVVQEMILEKADNKIAGYLDDRYIYISFEKSQFYGPVSTADKIKKLYNDLKFVIAIGNNAIRKSIAQKLALSSDDYVTVIHKSAIVSPSAHIASGTVIMPGAVINANAEIGHHCIINTGAVIEHDCIIDDFVHISPNATLTGNVKIGVGSQIGAGATVLPNLNIEEWSAIGAGAVVIDSIPANSTAVGVPALIKNMKVSGGLAVDK